MDCAGHFKDGRSNIGGEGKVRIVIGADHRGYELKGQLAAHLEALGHEVEDVGTTTPEPVDYPDFAEAVGIAIREGRAERGVLVCGSGVGASVAANKIVGVRAAVCHDVYSAHQGVEHDDMNVLCIGGRSVGEEVAKELVAAFGGAQCSGEGRTRRRRNKGLGLGAGRANGPSTGWASRQGSVR